MILSYLGLLAGWCVGAIAASLIIALTALAIWTVIRLARLLWVAASNIQ